MINMAFESIPLYMVAGAGWAIVGYLRNIKEYKQKFKPIHFVSGIAVGALYGIAAQFADLPLEMESIADVGSLPISVMIIGGFQKFVQFATSLFNKNK